MSKIFYCLLKYSDLRQTKESGPWQLQGYSCDNTVFLTDLAHLNEPFPYFNIPGFLPFYKSVSFVRRTYVKFG